MAPIRPSLKDIGSLGENLVEEYLVKNKWKILNRNFRIGHLEIDIIARDQKEIVFVEVKTRTSHLLDNPNQALSSGQIQKIKRAMLLYSGINKICLENIRFDFVAVFLNNNTRKANWKHYIDILK
ncbi:MAG TPA: YraN family protein [bacterium]|nr:YraN family protein [bacterium]